jgi:hypothetical protein
MDSIDPDLRRRALDGLSAHMHAYEAGAGADAARSFAAVIIAALERFIEESVQQEQQRQREKLAERPPAGSA